VNVQAIRYCGGLTEGGNIMKHVSAFIVLIALCPVARSEDKPRTDARQAVEGYVTAALAGKVADAAALAVEGQSPAKTKGIEKFRKLVGAKTLKIDRVLASGKKGRAIAVSEAVKLTKANPDGRDSGVLVFALDKAGDNWLVRDIDFRNAADAKEKVQGFAKKNPDAKEIPAKAEKKSASR
jgi:hypothetical protein